MPPIDAGNLRLTGAAAAATALAAIGLSPVLQGGSWYPPVLLAIATVAVIGGAARHFRAPLPLHPVFQGLGLVELLLVLVARDDMHAWFVPSGAAVETLRGVMSAGVLAINRSVPPAEPTPGIVAVIVLSVGMAALLVDVLAVPLRMPVLAGLPLAALYLVPAFVTRAETPWWCFAPAAAGWLLLLLADSRERLVEWGRVLDRQREVAADAAGAPALPRNATTTATPGMSSAARRLGLLAVALAVAVPVLLPGFTEPVLRGGSGPGAGVLGAGGNGGIAINPLVSLKREFLEQSDQVLLTYRTDDPSPDYLRLVSLERFDGQTWSPRELSASNDNEVNGGLPPQISGLDQQATFPVRRYDVSVDRLDNRYLPLPATTITVAVGQGWHYDAATRVVFSDDQSTRGSSYVATAVDTTWSAAALRALTASSGAAAPTGIDPMLDTAAVPVSLAQTAHAVTSGATTAYDQAVALQTWFRTTFRYSTNVVSGNDASYLEQFLRDKVGYCEQFAATMALMARTLGIPARVAVGFTQGAPLGDGRWQVTVRDAHAWPELWLDGAGWVRFEPTPRSDSAGVAVPRYADGSAPADPGGVGPTGPGANANGNDKLNSDRNKDRRLGSDLSAGGDVPLAPTDQGPSPWRSWAVLVLLVVGLVAALAPGVIRRSRRQRRLHGHGATAESAWAEVRDSALDLRQPWPDAESPRERGAALLRVVEPVGGGEVHAALARLVLGVERERYARPGSRASGGTELPSRAADVSRVRSALAAMTERGPRWRAVVWPPTVTDPRLRRARAAAEAGPSGDPADAVGERELAATLSG